MKSGAIITWVFYCVPYFDLQLCNFMLQQCISNVLLLVQEANTEKIFYGLDDIKEASDVIIVITILLLGIFS